MNMCSLIAFAAFRRFFFWFIFVCVHFCEVSLRGIEPSTGSSPETDALKYQKACGAA